MIRTRILIAALALSACSSANSVGGPASSGLGPTVLSVSPSAGAMAVNPSQPVTITFSAAMMTGMESRVVVHENSVRGAQVAGTATWSANRSILTFMPAAPLKPLTTYVIHLSPELTGRNGSRANLGSCLSIGGSQVSSGMMSTSVGSGMMNGQWGPGMMGEGWRSSDGSFGMYFTFRTS